MKADLASRAAWAPFHLEDENPELDEARARAVPPAAGRRTGPRRLRPPRCAVRRPAAGVGAGRGRARRVGQRGSPAASARMCRAWLTKLTDSPRCSPLPSATRIAAAVAEPGCQAARQQGAQSFLADADHLSSTSNASETGTGHRSVARSNRPPEATSHGPSTGCRSPSIAPTIPAAAASRCARWSGALLQRGTALQDRQQIEKRAERCRAKARLCGPTPAR